jgi:hypothetical protein
MLQIEKNKWLISAFWRNPRTVDIEPLKDEDWSE